MTFQFGFGGISQALRLDSL